LVLQESLQALQKVAKEVGLNLSGALLNRDGGFDAAHKSEVHFQGGLDPTQSH